MKSRFGIGINDERIPSGLMGKTRFAKKFEASFRNPVLDTLFRKIDTILLNDRYLNFLYHNRSSFPFQGIKNLNRYFGSIKNQFYPYSKGFISAFDLIPMARSLIDFSRDVKKKKRK